MRIISFNLLPHVISDESIAYLGGVESINGLNQIIDLPTLRDPDLDHLCCNRELILLLLLFTIII